MGSIKQFWSLNIYSAWDYKISQGKSYRDVSKLAKLSRKCLFLLNYENIACHKFSNGFEIVTMKLYPVVFFRSVHLTEEQYFHVIVASPYPLRVLFSLLDLDERELSARYATWWYNRFSILVGSIFYFGITEFLF